MEINTITDISPSKERTHNRSTGTYSRDEMHFWYEYDHSFHNRRYDSRVSSLDEIYCHYCQDCHHDITYATKYSETPHISGMTTSPTVTHKPKILEGTGDVDNQSTSDEMATPTATPELFEVTGIADQQFAFTSNEMTTSTGVVTSDLNVSEVTDDDNYKQSLCTSDMMTSPSVTPELKVSGETDNTDYKQDALYSIECMAALTDASISEFRVSEETDETDETEVIISEETEYKVVVENKPCIRLQLL